jgi:hypothetical protein
MRSGAPARFDTGAQRFCKALAAPTNGRLGSTKEGCLPMRSMGRGTSEAGGGVTWNRLPG